MTYLFGVTNATRISRNRRWVYSAWGVLGAILLIHQHAMIDATNTNICLDNYDESATKEGCTQTTTPESNDSSNWWDRILNDGQSIVSNGNVYPPPSNDHRDNCLLLLTSSQVLRHCPNAIDEDDATTVIHRHDGRRYRGAFAAVNQQRIWVLSSPRDTKADMLQELDTSTGQIVQILMVPGSVDGHDTVRVNDSVFLVDTKSGDIMELALPPSAPMDAVPITPEYIDWLQGLLPQDGSGVSSKADVTVLRHHTGFTRGDHANNVAVHPNALIVNLHGGRKSEKGTRVSALSRMEGEGVDHFDVEKEEGLDVENVGRMCHNLAFWKEQPTSDVDDGKIKVISLDSSTGSLVSVVLSGPSSKERQREVLWKPDLSHPVLQPMDKSGYRGNFVFAKGLAVQGDVAYFGVSAARKPKYRLTVNPTLLVAVDLVTKQELWVRSVETHGLINHVISESYLGYQVKIATVKSDRHEDDEESREAMIQREALHMKGDYPDLITFDVGGRNGESRSCLDDEGQTRKLHLHYKFENTTDVLIHKEHDPTKVIMNMCNLDVSAIANRLIALGDQAFTKEGQSTNSKIINPSGNMERIKPGVHDMRLIFSGKDGTGIHHLAWLTDWLPLIDSTVLKPLGIQLNTIIRMQFAKMPSGSDIKVHVDKNGWMETSHRVHVPIITHGGIFFLTKRPKDEYTRIRAFPGEAYEFNNAVPHLVHNLGGDRVHLIIDWIEEEVESPVKLMPGQECIYGTNAITC